MTTSPEHDERLAKVIFAAVYPHSSIRVHCRKANRFIDWFTFSDDSIDAKSKTKAYAMFDSSFTQQAK
jgi:hypothetical protein